MQSGIVQVRFVRKTRKPWKAEGARGDGDGEHDREGWGTVAVMVASLRLELWFFRLRHL